MIDKDRNPPAMMNYEEFNLRIAYLRLAIKSEKRRRKIEKLKNKLEVLIDREANRE